MGQKTAVCLIQKELKERIAELEQAEEQGGTVIAFRESRRKNVLQLIVKGTAGTGKTYVIHATQKVALELLGDDAFKRIAILAPTGTAAHNIGGVTEHSFLGLPLGHELVDLTGKRLDTVSENCKHLWMIIFDERSMIGARQLSFIDARLKQCTGRNRTAFGGVSLIMFGDDGQLPPIGDRAVWKDADLADFKGLHDQDGNRLYRKYFKDVVSLKTPFRQIENDPFYAMLLRAREGELKEHEEETQLLATRKWQEVSVEERKLFEDTALHLSPFREDVWEHNIQKLDALGNPIIKIEAIHNNKVAAAADNGDVSLKKQLYIAEGSRVMLTVNLWTEAGLVNGTMGEVVGYHFDPRRGNSAGGSPRAIFVKCPTYKGPRFPGFPETEEWRHVLPITRYTIPFVKSGTSCTREQFPLTLAWAVTIHKSQGMTIGPGESWERMLLDLGRKELSTGATFVALSRAKSLDCILFPPGKFPTLERLALCKTDSMPFRKKEDALLDGLSRKTAHKNADLIRAGIDVHVP